MNSAIISLGRDVELLLIIFKTTLGSMETILHFRLRQDMSMANNYLMIIESILPIINES